MSSSNGSDYTTKSMNGIITLSDGMGSVIEDGTITATNIAIDNLKAITNGNTCSIYANAGTVSYGNLTNQNNIGNIVVQGSNILASTAGNSNGIFTNGGTLTIGNLTNQNNIGNVVIQGSNILASMAGNSSGVFTNAGILTVGNSSNQNNIGNLTIQGSTISKVINLASNAISDVVALFNNITSGSITLGSTCASVNIATSAMGEINFGSLSSVITLGTIQFYGTAMSNLLNISANSPSAPAFIYPDITTGLINIGNGISSGVISLGSSITSGIIHIGNSTGFNGIINIGANSTVANTINIGKSTTTLNLGIIRFLSSVISNVVSITSATTGDAITLFNNITSGSISVGSSLTTGTLNLGVSSGVSSVINIAGSNTNTFISGNTFFGKPIGLNYSTLPTFTAGQVGYTLSAINTANVLIPNGAYGSAGALYLPIGVWSVSSMIRFGNLSTSAVSVSRVQIWFNTNYQPTTIWALSNTRGPQGGGQTATEICGNNNSCIITCNQLNILVLYLWCEYSGVPNNSLYISTGEARFYATRIA